MQQFLLEALIFFILSYLLANFMYWLALPPLEKYLGHPLSIHLFQQVGLQVAALIILILICLLTGYYPAYLFSRYRIVNSIKGNLTDGLSGELFRKGLITFQFVITVIVIVATIVVYAQYRFLNNKDLGYDKNNLWVINGTKWGEAGQVFKNELLNRHGVANATITNWGSSGPIMNYNSADPKDKDNSNPLRVIEADIDFASTLGIKVKSGRLFNGQLISDLAVEPIDHPKVLVSEDISSLVDFELGKPIMEKLNVRVIPIGVMRSFHIKSLLNKTEPFIILNYTRVKYGSMYIRVKPGADKQVITALQKLWPKFYPTQTLNYSYMPDVLEKQYRAEDKLNKQLGFFTLLIVFITCLGLYGLVSITVEKRTKEIGIRKVMGARVLSILNLISKDFLKLVVLAFFVATPLVWFLLSKWLMNYPYRVEIQWWMFALAAFMVIAISFFTISMQTWKAATSNPVKAFREE